jgi:hypothetical protein
VPRPAPFPYRIKLLLPLSDYGRRHIFVEGDIKVQLTHKEDRFHIVKIDARLPDRLRKVSLAGA